MGSSCRLLHAQGLFVSHVDHAEPHVQSAQAAPLSCCGCGRRGLPCAGNSGRVTRRCLRLPGVQPSQKTPASPQKLFNMFGLMSMQILACLAALGASVAPRAWCRQLLRRLRPSTLSSLPSTGESRANYFFCTCEAHQWTKALVEARTASWLHSQMMTHGSRQTCLAWGAVSPTAGSFLLTRT